MAAYEYDEAGVMATYFLITVLALVLIPLTLASLGKRPESVRGGCECDACLEQRARIQKREGALNFTKKTYFLIGGWIVLGFFSWKASTLKVTNKVYDPFEILGIASSTTEKEIKSHFKKLSRQFHPDKVKATAELTLEEIQNKFVDITKAYKSLTDEKIRKNWLEWNNPDGPQATSMGIALPKWIVESQNNIWVLGFYGLLFGGALPAVVGRWWFGSRQKTKDGVNALSAATFFKSITEESGVEAVVGTLTKAYQWELPATRASAEAELEELEKAILQKAGSRYVEIKKLTRDSDGQLHPSRLHALILIFAHLTRVPVQSSALQKEQRKVLLATPILLSALLNVSIARNWLVPTIWTMRLHSYLAQALPPNPPPRIRLTQLPGLAKSDIDALSPRPKDLAEVLTVLEDNKDERATTVKKAIEKWGRAEIVDASFKVIGERVVAPSSIVFLVIKLRLTPPGVTIEPRDLSVEETKRVIKANEEKDDAFLLVKDDAEDIPANKSTSGYAHAPYWPADRKPTWWLVLGDDKQHRIVVPPVRISDIPFADQQSDRDYRSFKIQFQAPPSTGLFTWRLYVVSDTFAGEDATVDIQLKVEDPVGEEAHSEDDISEPDEDSLAGQMAAMRGGAVKKRDEDSDESGTDDDEESGSDSDSDSD